MSEQPLRQYPHEDLPQNTTHEVEGDVATDTYHIPGRPLPENVSEVPDHPREPRDNSHNENLPHAVDTRSADHAYATKPNIVRAPEDTVHERVLAGEDVSAEPEAAVAHDAVVRGRPLNEDGSLAEE